MSPKPLPNATAPSGRHGASSRQAFAWADWLLAAGLVVVVFSVYSAAWHGGLLWDDSYHIPRPELRSWQGLHRIWFEPGATEQYYPLLWSAFWVEHRLWGDAMLGYHLANLALHSVAAVMVAMLLRRLEIRGAWLAAWIFALHPVHVESVAWVTEQKNTLSTVFYLGAMLTYLRFDGTRQRKWYGLALLSFALALLTKTVTATLPCALLVIFWWKRGRLSWKSDVLPVLPFPLLGVMGGLFTAWFERTVVGAEGEAFNLNMVERGLIAGRAIWFYLSKLFWPTDLSFIYTRWQIDQAVWWQYLFPAAAAAALLGLWLLRHRTRAPLAAALLFIGTLFPALGFVNVYPFNWSFVYDHWQYVASLAIITVFASAVAWLLKRADGWVKVIGEIGCVALVAVLAVLSSMQARLYADVVTLYEATIAHNPDCWLAHNNLGAALNDRGRPQEAIPHFQEALRLKPDYDAAHDNWGNALNKLGRPQEAITHFQEALRLKPDNAGAHINWGNSLVALDHLSEAVAHYEQALRLNPNLEMARTNLRLIEEELSRQDRR